MSWLVFGISDSGLRDEALNERRKSQTLRLTRIIWEASAKVTVKMMMAVIDIILSQIHIHHRTNHNHINAATTTTTATTTSMMLSSSPLIIILVIIIIITTVVTSSSPLPVAIVAQPRNHIATLEVLRRARWKVLLVIPAPIGGDLARKLKTLSILALLGQTRHYLISQTAEAAAKPFSAPLAP